MPDFRLNKVAGDLGCDGHEAAVTHRGHLLDVAVVIPDKPQVGEQGGKVFPPGEGFGIQHDPVQFAVGLNVRVDLPR